MLELASSQAKAGDRCLFHLRLAYREHRLMERLVRLGTDLQHQNLVLGMALVKSSSRRPAKSRPPG